MGSFAAGGFAAVFTERRFEARGAVIGSRCDRDHGQLCPMRSSNCFATSPNIVIFAYALCGIVTNQVIEIVVDIARAGSSYWMNYGNNADRPKSSLARSSPTWSVPRNCLCSFPNQAETPTLPRPPEA